MSAKQQKSRSARAIPTPENSVAQLSLRLLQQLAVLLLAVLGFLFCLITSYELDLPTATLVWTAIAFCLLFLAVFSVRRSGLFALVCLALAGVYGILHAADLLQGALLLIERAITPLSLQLPDSMQLLLKPTDMEEAQLLITHAAQALVFVVSFLSAFFIISEPSVPGLALSTLPLLIPAPFYLLSPARLPFFMLFAAHMMVFAFNNAKRAQTTLRAGVYVPQSRRKANQLAQRAAQHSLSLLALPLIALAAILSSIILPQEGYQRPDAIENLQQQIFSLDFGKDAFWRSNDGLTRGDLTSLSSIRFSGKTALLVRVSDPLSLYLRDYAGALYTEDGWKNVSSSDFSDLANSVDIAPQNLLASALAASGSMPSTFTLSVQNVSATPQSIWTPPGLITHADEITNAGYVQDTALAFASSASASNYTIEAVPVGMSLYSVPNADDGFEKAYKKAAGSADGLNNASGNGADTVRNAAKAYIGYLFDTYTTLPDATQKAADRLLQTYGIHAIYDGNALNLAATCQSIRSLLADRCSYDYSPQEMPQGVDFSTWFLEDAQSGYCVHFATTATVLLRALGIPARYAEGYIIIQKDYNKTPDANGFIKIEDTHAHAWVEVFDPSILEWVPVEVTESTQQSSEPTPSESGEPTLSPEDENAQTTPEPTEEPTPTPTPEPTPEPTAEPESNEQDESTPDPNTTPEETSDDSAAQITPTPAPSSEGTQDGSTTQDGEDASEDGGNNGARPPLWPVFAILAIVGIPLGAFGFRKYQHERLMRTFLQKDSNAAVLAAARYVLKMLRFACAPAMQPLESPELYAYNVARQNPAVDRARLESALLIAQRATFSGRTCSKKERDEVITFAGALVSALPARMKRLKRLLFRWRFPAN
ncbi:MAG: transglutaminase-like domain-containing protein [Christensenella sp.]|nr:transglutaminase-like domain-containing protein [Christensenella sp.]